MLLYNQPLELKDTEGNVIYTIKDLTMDAEYELENLAYAIQEKKSILLSGDRYVTLTEEELELSEKYFNVLSLKTDIIADKKEEENDMAAIESQLDNLWVAIDKLDKIRMEAGKKILTFNDVLHNLPKTFVKEAARWLKTNIVEFKDLGYYECVIELNKVNGLYLEYKEDIKKK